MGRREEALMGRSRCSGSVYGVLFFDGVWGSGCAPNCVLSRVVGSSFDLPPLSPFSDWFHALAKI
jgi:hypothetical protein